MKYYFFERITCTVIVLIFLVLCIGGKVNINEPFLFALFVIGCLTALTSVISICFDIDKFIDLKKWKKKNKKTWPN
jgi:hypothetical protein